MRRAPIFWSTIFLIFLGAAPVDVQRHCDHADGQNWLATDLGCLHFKSFAGDSLSEHPNLVIVLHGDAPFNKPGYHYRMAQRIAQTNKNTIAVGILRPGYTDPENYTSAGERGITTGDNYTPEVIAALEMAIADLQKRYQPQKTLLVGHSGGAALVGDLIGTYPNLADAAVLAACPCEVSRWRAHMQGVQPLNWAWSFPVRSVSPHQLASKVSRKIPVLLIAGENDEVVPLSIIQEYVRLLTKNGVNARLVVLPQEGHEILLDPKVGKEIAELVKGD